MKMRYQNVHKKCVVILATSIFCIQSTCKTPQDSVCIFGSAEDSGWMDEQTDLG